MKNTLALGAILFGAIVVYGGYKNWTIADTIRFFTGQEMHGDVPGVVKGNAVTDGGKTIQEMPTAPEGYEWTGDFDANHKWYFHLVPSDPNNAQTPPIPDSDPRNAPGTNANTAPPDAVGGMDL